MKRSLQMRSRSADCWSIMRIEPIDVHRWSTAMSPPLGVAVVVSCAARLAPPTGSEKREGRDAGLAKLSAVRIADFKLERFFARWEFSARFLLGASDAESFAVSELLDLSGPDDGALWSQLRLGYTESPGHPLLRAEIASLYDGLGADDVLVFTGAEEAIFSFANVALGAGDHA